MNKVKIFVSCGILLMSSCKAMKEVTLSDIGGEWKIVEMHDSTLNVSNAGSEPFIGFDTKSGLVYGYSGCNRIMSSLDLNAAPGRLELNRIAGTMMACPDMEMESTILSTLSMVKSYRKGREGQLMLCDSTDTPLMVLKKRFDYMPLAELNGKWSIASVYGEELPEDAGSKPFIVFDTKKSIISGNAGCNNFTGRLKVVQEDKLSIEMSDIATTRMYCPEMDVENNILSALGSARIFGRVDSGRVALYTSGGIKVLELIKNN